MSSQEGPIFNPKWGRTVGSRRLTKTYRSSMFGYVRLQGVDNIFSGTGYLAYVVDTHVNEEKNINEVSVVREFFDVFPDDLLGYLPSDRWNSEST